ncbi:CBN-PCP-5 protein, partial [Aphelenchoides avenae]
MARVSTLIFLLASIVARVRADVKALTVKTIKVKTDHSKTATVQDTYDHRYLYNTEDYDKAKGPVLFYAGGEGDIKDIAEKQKLFRTLAQNLTAAIVFAEHRYYGESFPAGSKTSLTLDNLKYLTVENVLADYVAVINDFRTNVGTNANAPVIVYGSKYAGLLAAWLKVQNDQLVTGAIASSAPVLDFDKNTDARGRPALGDYDRRITKIYTDAGCNLDALKRAFTQLPGAKAAELNTFFRLSPKIDATVDGQKDEAIKKIRYLIRQALYAMAENNYPYAAKTGWNGLEMPANPVQ